MPSIILFPGQGSQFIGMGKRLLNISKVERMFQMASEVFKMDLKSLCLDGPKTELDKTVNCQAAVFITSVAAVEYLKETNPLAVKECYATAGFSVGEYASLVLAGSISFEDALKVIKVRSSAMQSASEKVPSGLSTVHLTAKSRLGLAQLAARKWCKEQLLLPDPVECEVSNFLYAGCKVIGGNREALEFIELNHKEFDIVRVKRLPVSGAFHTRLMESAKEPLQKVLKEIQIKRPLIQFYSNFDAELCSAPEKIRRNLVYQVSHPVKWEQILNKLYYDENLPLAGDSDVHPAPSSSKSSTLIDPEGEKKVVKSPRQTPDRVYPDVYECGPGSQSGPILRLLNRKAYLSYKHIQV